MENDDEEDDTDTSQSLSTSFYRLQSGIVASGGPGARASLSGMLYPRREKFLYLVHARLPVNFHGLTNSLRLDFSYMTNRLPVDFHGLTNRLPVDFHGLTNRLPVDFHGLTQQILVDA
ncbi:hypothetical protein AVEN_209741-1 [Araneus ventricosus]|uniref:Uncharacterized protein n=1 Tax=Araneus ventricosus TaxID=182803 RepID=A0A4Y2CFD8_ARAVE|nr:hypothetical protein AVEN_209741-1 [Araneus ventricosus]